MAKNLHVILIDQYGEKMTITDPISVLVCEREGKKETVVKTFSVVEGKDIFHYDSDMSPVDMKDALKRLQKRKFQEKTDAQKLVEKIQGGKFDREVVGELIRKMNESISSDKP